MDKIILQSSRSVAINHNNFAVAVLQDEELHLTPLKGVIELKPVFNYLDKHDKRSKDDNKDGIKISFCFKCLKFIFY